jgi:hypothetical protein
VSNGMLYDEESEIMDVKEERNIIMTGLEQYQGGTETAFSMLAVVQPGLLVMPLLIPVRNDFRSGEVQIRMLLSWTMADAGFEISEESCSILRIEPRVALGDLCCALLCSGLALVDS